MTTFLPTYEEAEERLGGLGIDAETTVVGSADTANLYASRLWHVLTAFGHARVALLDGGIDRWTVEARPLEHDMVEPTPTRFDPDGDAVRATLVGRDEIRARLDDPRLRIPDVRAAAEFDGSERRATRGGHIPGAILLPWDGNLSDDQTMHLRTRSECARRPLGLHLEDEIVAYCQGGVRAAHTALALSLAGYRNVRIYDGSWAEWRTMQHCRSRRARPRARSAWMTPTQDQTSIVNAFSLSGRVAFVTGGNGGLGRAIALARQRDPLGLVSDRDDSRDGRWAPSGDLRPYPSTVVSCSRWGASRAASPARRRPLLEI